MERSFEDIQLEARAIHSLLGGPDVFAMEPKIAGFTRPRPISVPMPCDVDNRAYWRKLDAELNDLMEVVEDGGD